MNLDTAAFDAQINLQPPSEKHTFQLESIQAQPDVILSQYDPSPTPQPASSEPSTHQPAPQNQQTILTTPTTTAFTFSFAIPSSWPVANREKPETRCAPCTKALCEKRLTCEGRIHRDNCSCDHPQLQKGERVRISEKRVMKQLALQDNEVTIWKFVQNSS